MLNQMGATFGEVLTQVSNLLLLSLLYGTVAWWAASRRAGGPSVALEAAG
jgi:hypothetical protein